MYFKYLGQEEDLTLFYETSIEGRKTAIVAFNPANMANPPHTVTINGVGGVLASVGQKYRFVKNTSSIQYII